MPTTVQFILLLIGSYLFGSVPLAYIIARWTRGIDLRRFSSGNIGASNLAKATSLYHAIPVGIFDLLKGTLMVFIARLLDFSVAQQVAVGLAAVVGHNWSVYLRFNGGRGVTTSLGVAFILMPWGVVVFVAIALFTLVKRTTPLPVLLAIAALPLASWLFHQPLAITLGLLAILLIMIIRRLTAPRSELSTSVKLGELLKNRLVFDRDIRDAKTWLARKHELATDRKNEENLP